MKMLKNVVECLWLATQELQTVAKPKDTNNSIYQISCVEEPVEMEKLVSSSRSLLVEDIVAT